MAKLRLAVATDDGKHFVARHFGDAESYDVYEISPDGAEFLLRVTNETEEEEELHADPKKAQGIAAILKKQGVQVALTKLFGPNIKRIKKKFVCVLTGHEEIAAGLVQVQQDFQLVVAEWEKGEERGFLDWRKSSGNQ